MVSELTSDIGGPDVDFEKLLKNEKFVMGMADGLEAIGFYGAVSQAGSPRRKKKLTLVQ